MIRTIFLVFLIVVSGFAIAAATDTVAADDQNNETPLQECEQIDEQVQICDSYLEDGDAVLELHSDVSQSVVIADSGAFIDGGEVDTRTVDLEADDRTTVRMPVTEARGFAGVTINTDQVAYAVPLEDPDDGAMLPGDPSTADAWVATATTASIFVLAVPISVVAVRRMRGVIRRVF